MDRTREMDAVEECSNYCKALADKINNVKFKQGFWGYDTVAVDPYLDDLADLVEYHGSKELVSVMTDTTGIAGTVFRKSFRGYDANEVDVLLRRITRDIEKLNEIKRKFI